MDKKENHNAFEAVRWSVMLGLVAERFEGYLQRSLCMTKGMLLIDWHIFFLLVSMLSAEPEWWTLEVCCA